MQFLKNLFLIGWRHLFFFSLNITSFFYCFYVFFYPFSYFEFFIFFLFYYLHLWECKVLLHLVIKPLEYLPSCNFTFILRGCFPPQGVLCTICLILSKQLNNFFFLLASAHKGFLCSWTSFHVDFLVQGCRLV